MLAFTMLNKYKSSASKRIVPLFLLFKLSKFKLRVYLPILMSLYNKYKISNEVSMLKKPRYKRGYPLALLVGLEKDFALLWQIFSQVVKPLLKVKLNGKRTNDKVLYNFHESVINILKPIIKQGIRSIVLTSPIKTTYSKDFLRHIKNHHRYLLESRNPNHVNFAELNGSAENQIKISELVKTKEFKMIIEKTTSKEADQVVNSLEKYLYDNIKNSFVLYSLKEIEDTIYSRKKINTIKIEYLVLTDEYLTDSRQKNRIHRLLQIAKNKKVKTRVIDAKTSAGKRINQFGGIVFFTKEFVNLNGNR